MYSRYVTRCRWLTSMGTLNFFEGKNSSVFCSRIGGGDGVLLIFLLLFSDLVKLDIGEILEEKPKPNQLIVERTN